MPIVYTCQYVTVRPAKSGSVKGHIQRHFQILISSIANPKRRPAASRALRGRIAQDQSVPLRSDGSMAFEIAERGWLRLCPTHAAAATAADAPNRPMHANCSSRDNVLLLASTRFCRTAEPDRSVSRASPEDWRCQFSSEPGGRLRMRSSIVRRSWVRTPKRLPSVQTTRASIMCSPRRISA